MTWGRSRDTSPLGLETMPLGGHHGWYHTCLGGEGGARRLSLHRLGVSRADVRQGQRDKRAVRNGQRESEKKLDCARSLYQNGKDMKPAGS